MSLLEKDFYSVLRVSKTASKQEIKDAFRRLAFQYHPDRNKDAGATERFVEIKDAYAVLSDAEKRACYDALGSVRYNDPMEVFRYHLERLIAEREGWSGQDEYGEAVSYYNDDDYIWEWIETFVILLLVYLFWRFLP